MDSSRERNRDRAIERLLGQSRREPPDGGVTAACLDAETIAALMSGGLSGPAVEAAHAHLADCARCQSLAAALVRIDSATQPEQPKHVWRSWLTWLVPLTAAAAAIVLWVVVPDRTSAPLSRAVEVQKPAAEPGSQQPPAPAPTAAPAPAVRTAPALPPAPAEARADASELERPRVVVPDKPPTLEQDLKPPLSAAEASPSAAPAAAPAVPAAPAAAPPAPSANALGSARTSARRFEAAGFEIVSPDLMIRWRIAGSSVERSTDGGARWDSQSTGSAAALMAGASPSPLVCWIVGRGGVVLRSIDGRTWSRVVFPEMTDLQSVRARDANSVSVTTADGRNFSTTDAGATWVPGLLQGF